MTAIDIAVQSKKLGAETVTHGLSPRPEQMKASAYERELAQTNGVDHPLLGEAGRASMAVKAR